MEEQEEGISMKKAMIIILVAILIVGVYFTGTGFSVRNDVVIYDFTVSEDGSYVTLNVGVSSSAGYIRAVKNISDEEEKADLQFYSAFGGINGKIGSKKSFQIPLTEKVKEIYTGGQLVLFKNEETEKWERA